MIVLGFTGGLNIASFKKNYTNSLVAGYSVVGNEYVRNIEYALKYGKPLTNFFGLQELLKATKQDAPGLKNIQIILKDGQVSCDLKGALTYPTLPAKLLGQVNFKNNNPQAPYIYLLDGSDYHIFLPIRDRQNTWIASMDLIFEAAIVNSRTNLYLQQIIKYSVILWFISLIILIISIYRLNIVNESGQINQRLVLTIIITLLSVIQIIFGWLNYNMFKGVYTDVAKEYTSKTALIIQKDINQVIGKGVTYQDLHNIEGWLKRFIVSAPEIDNIYITDARNNILFTTNPSIRTKAASLAYVYNLPLKEDIYHHSGSLKIVLSQKYINGKLITIALDMLTIMVTAFFFMIEVTLFLVILLKRPRKGQVVTEVSRESEAMDVQIIRPLGFMFFFSAFLSLTFIPVLMKELYQPIMGLSKTVVLGLPISIELLCGALATLIAGYFLEVLGWKPTFFCGLIFFLCGAFLSGISWGAISFIIARGLVGIGYGFSLISMLGFVNSAPTLDTKNVAISDFNAGSYAGVNCGCASGALLAERIGFSKVFFVAIAIAFLAGIFAFFFIKNRMIQRGAKTAQLDKIKGGMLSFFLNLKVAPFFLLVVLPLAVCTMFLDFFLPLYSKTVGVSAADIGRVFLMNGIAIVYLGPVISKYIGRHMGFKRSILLAAALFALALLIFAIWSSFVTAFLAAFLLGVAVGFGDAAQNNYLLSLEATSVLGEGKAIGLLNVTTKIGQSMGTVVFGTMMSLGVSKGIGSIGFALVGLLILFIIISRLQVKRLRLQN
jgi:predicted MFS family arabinose efflux permease